MRCTSLSVQICFSHRSREEARRYSNQMNINDVSCTNSQKENKNLKFIVKPLLTVTRDKNVMIGEPEFRNQNIINTVFHIYECPWNYFVKHLQCQSCTTFPQVWCRLLLSKQNITLGKKGEKKLYWRVFKYFFSMRSSVNIHLFYLWNVWNEGGCHDLEILSNLIVLCSSGGYGCREKQLRTFISQINSLFSF